MSDIVEDICTLFESWKLSDARNTVLSGIDEFETRNQIDENHIIDIVVTASACENIKPDNLHTNAVVSPVQVHNIDSESDIETPSFAAGIPLTNRFSAFLENSAPLPEPFLEASITSSQEAQKKLFKGLKIDQWPDQIDEDSEWNLVGPSRSNNTTRGARGSSSTTRGDKARGARPKRGSPRGKANKTKAIPIGATSSSNSKRIRPDDQEVTNKLENIFNKTKPFKDSNSQWPGPLANRNLNSIRGYPSQRGRGNKRIRGAIRGNFTSPRTSGIPKVSFYECDPVENSNLPEHLNFRRVRPTDPDQHLGHIWNWQDRVGKRRVDRGRIKVQEFSAIRELGDPQNSSDYSLDIDRINHRLSYLLPAAYRRRELLNRRRAENFILLQETECNAQFLSPIRQQRIRDYQTTVGAIPLWKLVEQEFERNSVAHHPDPDVQLVSFERDILSARHLEVIREQNRIQDSESRAGIREEQLFVRSCRQIGIAQTLSRLGSDQPRTLRATTPPFLTTFTRHSGRNITRDWVDWRGPDISSSSGSSSTTDSIPELCDSHPDDGPNLTRFFGPENHPSANLPIFDISLVCDPHPESPLDSPCRNIHCGSSACREERVRQFLEAGQEVVPLANNIAPDSNLRESNLRTDPDRPPPYSEVGPPPSEERPQGPEFAQPCGGARQRPSSPNLHFAGRRSAPEGSDNPFCPTCGVRHNRSDRQGRPPSPGGDIPENPICLGQDYTVEFYDQQRNLMFRSRRPEGVFFIWGPGNV